MRLSEWLESTATSQAAFAERVGLSQGRISQIAISGTNSFSTAKLIAAATDGVVTILELMPPEPARAAE